jgi:hypothetical protein
LDKNIPNHRLAILTIMIRFFPHAIDNVTSGSSAYAQSILQINYQYFLTGLVEIEYTSDQQLVLLVSEGKDAGAFYVSGNSCKPTDPQGILNLWKNGDVSIRSVNLPRVALRAVRQVLEWSPPAQDIQTDKIDILRDYIQTCQAQRSDGLFHFLWPRSEGYLSMHFGQLLPIDAVFSSPSGTETGSECLAQILYNQDYPVRISYLSARQDSPSYQQQTLRTAMGELLKEIICQFTKRIGPGQSNTMLVDLNNAMRAQSWYLQIVGDQIQDTHVFPDVKSAVVAYQILIKNLAVYMYNALGTKQTQTLIADSLHSQASNVQQTIQKYALLPATVKAR